VTARDASPNAMVFPSRVQVETVMPRVSVVMAALATFIDPWVGCSGRDPSGQRKAYQENSNPLHVWTYVYFMEHQEKRPEPVQSSPCGREKCLPSSKSVYGFACAGGSSPYIAIIMQGEPRAGSRNCVKPA